MHTMALTLAALAAQGTQSARPGGVPRPNVTLPRLEASVEVDGRLDEAVWREAARLDGFHQFEPVDSRPAEEATEVLVWYSPTALYFGIIAHDRQPDAIRATVADRDNLGSDDRVTIYLDTFNDRRRAFFFGVNPYGAQADGVKTEGASSAGNIFGGNTDYSPDYYFESKGRLNDSGYVVEIRIPFKSLRYPGNGPQRWGLNIDRYTQRTGYRDTWTDVRRASASFLAQAGSIDGLHDLQRGLVTEFQPFATVTAPGQRDPATGAFSRDNVDPSVGANLRLGLTNFSLDATANPDFSQVESDAGQVTVNERFALFFPEKRPFFLEGIELFSTPNQLVYTRRIVDPVAGAKITGKFGATGIAYLSAVDNVESGPDAWFNIARLRQDLGSNSLAGLTLTSREQGRAFNRVAALDSRVVFAKLYYAEAQVGGSWTRDAVGDARTAPLWKAEVDRTGRSFGFNYQINGIGRDFEAQSGFVNRTSIVSAHVFNRFTAYGGRGALVENFTTFFGPTRIWRYGGFGSDGAIEGEESATFQFLLRGGWQLSTTARRDFFALDPADYEGLTTDRGTGPVAFVPPAELSNLFGMRVEAQTPTFRLLGAGIGVGYGEVAIFDEGTPGRETQVSGSVNLRPASSIRASLRTTFSRITRASDGSEFARTIIPRAQVEYQPTRELFFRVIGEYRSQRQDALRDPVTGAPLLAGGTASAPGSFNGLRVDLLASYEPTPGTVAFFGYGSSLESKRSFGVSDLSRTTDGFFLKVAYLFRR